MNTLIKNSTTAEIASSAAVSATATAKGTMPTAAQVANEACDAVATVTANKVAADKAVSPVINFMDISTAVISPTDTNKGSTEKAMSSTTEVTGKVVMALTLKGKVNGNASVESTTVPALNYSLLKQLLKSFVWIMIEDILITVRDQKFIVYNTIRSFSNSITSMQKLKFNKTIRDYYSGILVHDPFT